MSSRVPASRLRTGDASLKAGDVSAQLRQARQNPMAEGSLIESLTTDGTTNLQFFSHGLARSFRSAMPAGQDYQGAPITYLTPSAVSAAGKDPARFFAVKPPSAVAIVFTSWVM